MNEWAIAGIVAASIVVYFAIGFFASGIMCRLDGFGMGEEHDDSITSMVCTFWPVFALIGFLWLAAIPFRPFWKFGAWIVSEKKPPKEKHPYSK